MTKKSVLFEMNEEAAINVKAAIEKQWPNGVTALYKDDCLVVEMAAANCFAQERWSVIEGMCLLAKHLF